MPEIDEDAQGAYAELRRRKFFDKNPDAAAAAAELVKRGRLRDLSGGSAYPDSKPKAEPKRPGVTFRPPAQTAPAPVVGNAGPFDYLATAVQAAAQSKLTPTQKPNGLPPGTSFAFQKPAPPAPVQGKGVYKAQPRKKGSMEQANTPRQIRDADPDVKQQGFSRKNGLANIADTADFLFAPYGAVANRITGDMPAAKADVKRMLAPQGATAAAGRAFAQGVAPGAGGLTGFSAGARIGAQIPGPPVVKGIAGLAGGMLGAAGGGALVQAAQDKVLEGLLGSENFADVQSQLSRDQKENPLAVSLGGAATNILYARPTLDDVKAIPAIIDMVRRGTPLRAALQSEAGKMLSDTLRERVMEGGIEVLAAAGQSLVTGKPMSAQDTAIQAISGALMPGENRLGSRLVGGGRGVVDAVGGALASRRGLPLDFSGGMPNMQGRAEISPRFFMDTSDATILREMQSEARFPDRVDWYTGYRDEAIRRGLIPRVAPSIPSVVAQGVPYAPSRTPKPQSLPAGSLAAPVAQPAPIRPGLPVSPIPTASPYFVGGQNVDAPAPAPPRPPLMLPEAPPAPVDVVRQRLMGNQGSVLDLLRQGLGQTQYTAPVAPPAPVQIPLPQRIREDSIRNSILNDASLRKSEGEYVADRRAEWEAQPRPSAGRYSTPETWDAFKESAAQQIYQGRRAEAARLGIDLGTPAPVQALPPYVPSRTPKPQSPDATRPIQTPQYDSLAAMQSASPSFSMPEYVAPSGRSAKPAALATMPKTTAAVQKKADGIQSAIRQAAQPNSVIVMLRGAQGEARGVSSMQYDGTAEGAIAAHEQIMETQGMGGDSYYDPNQVSNIQSIRAATDAQGNVKYIISPNGKTHEWGTDAALYALGDLSAGKRMEAQAKKSAALPPAHPRPSATPGKGFASRVVEEAHPAPKLPKYVPSRTAKTQSVAAEPKPAPAPKTKPEAPAMQGSIRISKDDSLLEQLNTGKPYRIKLSDGSILYQSHIGVDGPTMGGAKGGVYRFATQDQAMRFYEKNAKKINAYDAALSAEQELPTEAPKAETPAQSSPRTPEALTQYTVEPYRYAKDSIVVKTTSPDQFKTPADNVLESLGGRYVDRAKGYVFPQSKEPKIAEAMEAEREKIRAIQAEEAGQLGKAEPKPTPTAPAEPAGKAAETEAPVVSEEMAGSPKQVEWATRIKADFLSDIESKTAQLYGGVPEGIYTERYRAELKPFEEIAIRLKKAAREANGGQPLGESNPYNLLHLRLKQAAVDVIKELAPKWAAGQTDAGEWIDGRDSAIERRFYKENAGNIEDAIIKEIRTTIEEYQNPAPVAQEVTKPDDLTSFPPMNQWEVGQLRPSDMLKMPEIKALIQKIEEHPSFPELKSLVNEENQKRSNTGDSWRDTSSYMLLNHEDMPGYVGNLPKAKQAKAVSLQKKIRADVGLRSGEPWSPFGNYLVDGGATVKPTPAAKRAALEASRDTAKKVVTDAIAADQNPTRRGSTLLPGAPNPEVINAGGKWLAYEVAIRGLDAQQSFQNSAEAIRAMADEFGDWVTLHKDALLESARDFWTSEVVPSLKADKAAVPVWIEGDEVLSGGESVKEKEQAAQNTAAMSDDYRMDHRPQYDAPEGHEIPEYALKNPRDFAGGNPKADRESLAAVRAIQGKPDAEVTIYRASPRPDFNPGDWITLSRTYAEGEAISADGLTEVPVHSMQVKASDIRWDGSTFDEFGYFPGGKNPFPPKKSPAPAPQQSPVVDNLPSQADEAAAAKERIALKREIRKAGGVVPEGASTEELRQALAGLTAEPEVHHSQTQDRDDTGKFVAQEPEPQEAAQEPPAPQSSTPEPIAAVEAPQKPTEPPTPPASATPAEPANPNARKLLKIATQQEIAQELGMEDWTERAELKRTFGQRFEAAAENWDTFLQMVQEKAASPTPGTLSDEERIVALQVQKDARQVIREVLDSGDTSPEAQGRLAAAMNTTASMGKLLTFTASEAGRSLGFGRALIDDSPGGFMKSVERAQDMADGKLSMQAQRELAQLALRAERVQEQVSATLESKAEAATEQAAEQVRQVKRFKRTAADTKKSNFGTDNEVFKRERYEAAKARLEEAKRAGRLNCD